MEICRWGWKQPQGNQWWVGRREGGRQVNIGNVITIITENIQEASLQVRNTENGLKMSPGTSAYLHVTDGSAKALPVLSDFWSPVLCTFLAFQRSITLISWSSACLKAFSVVLVCTLIQPSSKSLMAVSLILHLTCPWMSVQFWDSLEC